MKTNRSLFLSLFLIITMMLMGQTYHLLIGTYTDTGKSKGIYSYSINMNSGIFKPIQVVSGISNPSYINIAADGKFVYAVSESEKGSAACAFAFNRLTGKLKPLNCSLTQSAGPCYISSTTKNVFTANYGGGSLSVFGRKSDGSLTPVLQVIQHVGKSINRDRQNEPHVHQVYPTPDGKYVLVNDLGTDKISIYHYHPESYKNVLTVYDSLTVKLGSGPRHATFSRDGRKLYLVHEIDATVSVLSYHNGKLQIIQQTTVDRNDGKINRAADVHLSPDERFAYITNRGTANTISCFAVGKDGKLNFINQVPTEGDGPRNFAITPDGKYIFVGHQFSNNIVIFKRNEKSGKLIDTGKRIELGAPVCLKFYK